MTPSGERYAISDLRDYCYCPLYYRFLRESPAGGGPAEVERLHLDCIRRTAYFILYASQNGGFPNRFAVKQDYGRLLKAVFGRRLKGLAASTVTRGLEQCLALHDYLKRRSAAPVLIARKYALEAGGALVEGTMDAVLEDGGRLELLMLEGAALYDRAVMSCDIEVVAASVACRRLLARPLEVVTVYRIQSGTAQRAQIGNCDVKMAAAIIEAVVTAIRQRIYYPSAGRECRSCRFSVLCSSGKWLV